MRPFVASIIWLKEALEELSLPEFANQIQFNWCWEQIEMWYKSLSKKDKRSLKPLRDAILEAGNSSYCYLYLKHINRKDVEMRKRLSLNSCGS